MISSSLRVRLTVWYLLVFGAVLAGFSVFTYAMLARNIEVRLDASLLKTADEIAGIFREEMDDESQSESGQNVQEALSKIRIPRVLAVIISEGQPLWTQFPANQPMTFPASLANQADQAMKACFATEKAKGRDGYRWVALPAQFGNQRVVVLVAEPLDAVTQELRTMGRVFLLTLPLALLLAGLGGFHLAKKSLSPVAAMSEQAERIGVRNLHERLPVVVPDDELGRLATVFNHLLERLDQSFEGMKKFIADASHELRTPLTIIRSEAEIALSCDRVGDEYREVLKVITDETRHLSGIVADLLDLAQADAGISPLRLVEFYFEDVVNDCAALLHSTAMQKQLTLTIETAEDVSFTGDEELMRRLVFNLIENAVKYTPLGGEVTVKLTSDASRVVLVVADSGIGIPKESQDRIFERFYRVDRARTRTEGGCGLGLSIAGWVAEVHRGNIRVESQPEKGSTFTVELPR